jgi:phosphoribosylformylglycinamidine (FGAM) synthase-like enzyme
MALDTVAVAQTTPDGCALLSLPKNPMSMHKLFQSYPVMWPEHCSYKSSKVHLKQFVKKVQSDALLVGIVKTLA